MLEALPFEMAGGRLVAEVNALRYTLQQMRGRLVPVGEVRVQAPSEGLRSLLDRSAEPGDRETRSALGSLREVERRHRIRLAVEPRFPDAEVEALAEIARFLAGQSLDLGVGQSGDTEVEDGWHEIPTVWGSLGIDPPVPRAAAHEDVPDHVPTP